MKITEPTTVRGFLEHVTGVTKRAGDPSAVFTGISDDSRQVAPGDLFFCIPGARTDGSVFARQALEKGAAGLVVTPGYAGPDAPILIEAVDIRQALSAAVALCFRDVIGQLKYVGVTGTNGKTTTTQLIGAVLDRAGIPCSTVGTLGAIDPGMKPSSTPNTTPGPLQLIDTIRELVARGKQYLVMEVSSQGVVQHRASFLPFQAVVFTNFSPEHMETHHTLEAYREAKLTLFRWAGEEARRRGDETFVNIINLDDPESHTFLAACSGRKIGYTLKAEGSAAAHSVDQLMRGREDGVSIQGARMQVDYDGATLPVQLKMGGYFNLLNALAALAVARHLGVPGERAVLGLGLIEGVPGRFQRVPSEKRQVLVDYAHTSEGMEVLLSACRRIVPPEGKLVVVFGCGGDRDNSKRPRMGKSAATYADWGVITSDNPRSEAPMSIIGMILAGLDEGERARFHVEPDRRQAIREALARATSRDLVVVAGKGHETYQEVNGVRTHFDDVEIVREILEEI